MLFAQPHQSILVKPWRMGAALALLLAVAGCGQKGALYIPQTPVAAQRATLPQTVFGGSKGAAAPAAAASAPVTVPPPVLPDIPDMQ